MKTIFIVHFYCPEKDNLSDVDRYKNVTIERLHVYKEENVFQGERHKLEDSPVVVHEAGAMVLAVIVTRGGICM